MIILHRYSTLLKTILSILVLLIGVVPNSQAQEYTSRYFHYNQWYDAPVPFDILATTVDGADTEVMRLAGGGAVNINRGSYIAISGNEAVGYNGKILYVAGNIATGEHEIFVGNGFLQWTVPYQAANTTVDLLAGDAAVASATATIRGNRADGSDDLKLQITPGGSSTLSGTRGSYLYLEGQDVGGADLGGDATLSGGRGKSSNAGEYPTTTVYNSTIDGSDWGMTQISSAAATGNSRGASIQLWGNESGSSGALILQTGDSTYGNIYQRTQGGTWFWHDEDRNNATLNLQALEEEVTINVGAGAAGVNSAANLCASGQILGVGVRVTDAPGGGAATLDVGCTGGGNLDEFIDGISTALNTTGTYPTNGDGTASVRSNKTATTLTLTTDANVSGDSMKVRVIVYYLNSTAPSS